MRERLQKFSLSLHPQKDPLIEFGRHAAANRKRMLKSLAYNSRNLLIF
jgi:hypothetical protein